MRNALTGPRYWNVDLAISRQLGLLAGHRAELRLETFNLFNTVNYALPNNVIGSATTDFGKITDSVGGPRVMQLGARLRF